jgi:transposase
MLKMGQAHVIRHKVFIEGRSIRQVAREMMISRNTVRKYLAQSEPKRLETRPRERHMLEKVKSRIDALLKEWAPRTTAKQRITGSRIHEQLLLEGYYVGITTIRDYLAELKRLKREVFIPLLHLPGQVAQVDFFEVTIEIDGRRQKAWQFVMRLTYSGKDFVCIYERCNQTAFLDGHVRGFQHFGGVPIRVVYDNLSAAVKRRLGMMIELTDRFRAIASYYLFEPCFARPGEGHDKGSVEARGKGIRLRHLTPIPQGQTLAALNEQLLASLETATGSRKDRLGRTVKERFEEERPLFRPLPVRPFEARQVVPLVVDRQAMVRIEGAEYSLPSPWVSLQIMGFVGVADIRFECRSESLVVPKVPRGGRLVSYRHYLKELAHKPQAVRQVAPKLLAELGAPYQSLWETLCPRYGELEAARVVAKLVGAIDSGGEQRISQALRDILRQDPTSVPPAQTVVTPQPAVPLSLSSYHVESGHAADYDRLLEEASGE